MLLSSARCETRLGGAAVITAIAQTTVGVASELERKLEKEVNTAPGNVEQSRLLGSPCVRLQIGYWKTQQEKSKMQI
jgi:hypothetical protein